MGACFGQGTGLPTHLQTHLYLQGTAAAGSAVLPATQQHGKGLVFRPHLPLACSM